MKKLFTQFLYISYFVCLYACITLLNAHCSKVVTPQKSESTLIKGDGQWKVVSFADVNTLQNFDAMSGGKTIATKYATVDDCEYLVKYIFDNTFSMMPAVMSKVDPHYMSDIYVYEGEGMGVFKKQINQKAIKGYYVENGCFEDVPENYVRAALKQTFDSSLLDDALTGKDETAKIQTFDPLYGLSIKNISGGGSGSFIGVDTLTISKGVRFWKGPEVYFKGENIVITSAGPEFKYLVINGKKYQITWGVNNRPYIKLVK